MPQRQAVRLQLLLEARAKDAALNQRGARGAVDLEHPVQMTQINAHRPGVSDADVGLDATHDRGAAAEWDRGGLDVGAPADQVGYLALVCGIGDHVRSVAVVPSDSAHQIVVGLAERVDCALPSILRTERFQPGWRTQSRFGDRQRSEGWRRDSLARLDTEARMHVVAHLLNVGV